MASRMYITKAIVCGSKASMTSDKSYLLFTQDLGMLWATARSVRMEKSKQRYALQDFSTIRVSLVQGRSGWRIGSVEALGNPFLAAASKEARGGVAYITKILRRYVQGESVVPRAFLDTVVIQRMLSEVKEVQVAERYQQIYTLRLLDELGYITRTKDIQHLLQTNAFEKKVEEYVCTPEIEHRIHTAMQASHL